MSNDPCSAGASPASPAEGGPSARLPAGGAWLLPPWFWRHYNHGLPLAGTPALQIQRGRLRLFALAALPFLPACSRDPGHGPGEVHWDRDTCKRCNMAVSDRHYAAQIRGGPKHEVFKFDDIGCALFWLQEQKIPWAEAADSEIWVNDFRSSEWLDARKAHYLPGKTTPMAYGFGALAKPEAGSIDFATMRAAILARGK